MRKTLTSNLANGLTLLRLVSVIPLLIVTYASFAEHFMVAAGLFFLAVMTDVLDGFVARRLKQTSEFGAFADALFDKTVMYVMMFSLMSFEVLPYYLVFPMFLRDILVDGLRSYMAKQGRVLPANPSGKAKYALQSVAVIAGLLWLNYDAPHMSYRAIVASVALACALLVSLAGIVILYRAARSAQTVE